MKRLREKSGKSGNIGNRNMAGAKEAAEKGGIFVEFAKDVPQGLKPALILLLLRHD
jgi:hypothetical protein